MFLTYMVVGALAFHFMTHRYDETSSWYAGCSWRACHALVFYGADSPRNFAWPRFISVATSFGDMKRWGGLVIGGILFMVGSVVGINGAIESWVIRPVSILVFSLFICRRL